MACSQPSPSHPPGQAPERALKQTAMGMRRQSQQIQQSNAAASLQAPPLSGSGLGQGKSPTASSIQAVPPCRARVPIQSPKRPEGRKELNDKALCSITCPALALHDSPLRSSPNQSNASQMVGPGTPRPVTKAGLPAPSAVWPGRQLGCAVLCCAYVLLLLSSSVCVRAVQAVVSVSVGSVINGLEEASWQPA